MLKCLFTSSRSCTLLQDPEGDYSVSMSRRLLLNGTEQKGENRSVFSLFGLWPDTEYTLEAYVGDIKESELTFRTKKELCTLNVKRFGAKGDGEKDDIYSF